jgi:hypothetical protein
MDVLSESGSAIGLISLIAILEHVAIAKAFGKLLVRLNCPKFQSFGELGFQLVGRRSMQVKKWSLWEWAT